MIYLWCMNELIITKAGPDDLQTIHDMAQVVFRHTYREILSPEQMEYMMDWMYSPGNLKKQLEEGHVYYIAYSNGKPCGYLSVQREGVDPEGVEVFHLQKIYLLPPFQGGGMGRRLFDQAITHVRESKRSQKARIELNVNRSNPAVGFYKHLGLDILRQGDFHIGEGFYMNDYIMGIEL